VLADLNHAGHLVATRHLLQRRVAVIVDDGAGGFTPAGRDAFTEGIVGCG
jgi:hypothetical protein